MQLSSDKFALIFLLSFISYFIYYHGQIALQRTLDYFEPKTITSADFNRLITKADPCAQFKNINLVFTFPKKSIEPAIRRIATLGCFDGEESFLKVVKVATETRHEGTLLLSLIPIAKTRHTSTIPTIFYKCALNQLYKCVGAVLLDNPLLEYEGKNIVHLATWFDDLILLDLASPNFLYLHMKDDDGNVPLKYVKSNEMYDQILKRNELEAKSILYKKEHQANMDYVHKTKRLGFHICTTARVNLMFSNNNWIKINAQLRLEVPRETLFKYSYNILHNAWLVWYTPNFFSSSFIKFKNEEGVDAVGVTNDWLSSLLEIFFKANPDGNARRFTAPLFQPISDDSDLYQPTGLYDCSVYKFAGSIVALALSRGITTRVEFIPSLYRVILEIEPYRVEDLQVQNPIVYKNLNSLRDLFKKNVPLIDHNFKSIDEVEKYIESYSADLLYNNHKKFLKAFADGFRSKIPRKISKYLGLMDLKNVLRGTVIITTEDFRRNIEFGPFATTYQKNIFFKVIDKLTQEQRAKLIRFVTGRHGLPFGGLSELSKPITVFFESAPLGKLPTARTCFSWLYLPTFNTVRELKISLIKAIEYCNTIENN